MGQLAFGLLGPTVVTGDAGTVPLPGALRRRLLTRLLMSANQPVPVEVLREDLWEGRAPRSAASTLKSHVSLLRRSLGGDRLTFGHGAYALMVAAEDLDVWLFERDTATGQEALRDGDLAGAAMAMTAALGRWRGRALADAGGAAWATAESVRLEELRAASLEAWLQARIGLGEHQEVVAAAETAVVDHPFREGLWAKLIVALYRSGRQADALRAYQRVRSVLVDELGIEPGPELVGLEGAVLRHEAALLAPARPGPARREAAFGPAERPAPKEGSQPSNLAAELTSFVGREAQLAEIEALLLTGRLVTLTGSGGVGKTRIAVRIGHAARSRPGDGVWLAELASATTPSHILRQLANALGVREEAGGELTEVITRRLADGQQLLVLDNCEHVRQEVAALAVVLLRATDRLRLLVTSREPLRAPGESVYRVPSMSVPAAHEPAEPDRLLGSEAIRLLFERARSQRPTLQLDAVNGPTAASLCRRLDGIPLALELAAARVRSMSLADIEARLDGRFRLLTGGSETALPRQRTLRALVDWSYDLLAESERTVLGRLSVFCGGWDLAEAEVVAGAGELDRWEVTDALSSLVDKSLVQAETGGQSARYWLLETVRDYTHERLEAQGAGKAAAARAEHARFFFDLAEAAAPQFAGGGQVAWRSRLELDHENLRTAFRHFLTDPDGATVALRFATALGWFWSSRGSYSEGVEEITAALERPEATDPTPIRGAALNMGGHLLCRSGDLTQAQAVLDEAAAIAGDLGDVALMADALRNLAWVADRRGEHAEAIRLATQALELAARSGEDHLVARAYDVRAAARQEQDPEGARADYAASLRYCALAGDHHGQASTLNNLAVLELEQGNRDQARQRFEEGLDVARRSESLGILPYLEYGLGLAATLEGDYQTARPAFASALQIARQTGQRSLVAYGLLGIAIACDDPGDARRAATLHGAAMALFDELRETAEPLEAGLRERSLSALHRVLGEGVGRHVEAGRSLALSEAVAVALRTSTEADPPGSMPGGGPIRGQGRRNHLAPHARRTR